MKKMLSRIVLVFSIGVALVSCSVQMGTYSETDGVYYDPEKDILPETARYESAVGEEYEYNSQPPSIAEGAYDKKWRKNNQYWDNDNTSRVNDSDWGTYTGSETRYYNSGYGGWGFYNPYRWGWGYPYGFYGSYYGAYYGNWGWNWGLGLGWGWNSFYSPYWGYYSPYWGYGMWGNYGWGGYGYPVYYRSVPYARSGSVSTFRNGGNNISGSTNRSSVFSSPSSQRHSGFSNPYQGRQYPQNSSFRNNNNYRQNNSNYNTPRSGGFNNSNSNGGFRSSGFSSPSRSGSSGFSSPSRSGRVGGFR